MHYIFIIALQAYCVYHLYKNRNSYYWLFLILFFGPIGCAIYLLFQAYNKQDIEKVTSEITQIVNPTKRIKDLEKQLQFSETYQNRVNLAHAFLDIKDYESALSHYLEALKDTTQNHFYVISKLVEIYYSIEDFNQAVFYANQIKEHQEFKKSKTQFLYGLSEEKLGNLESAEVNLRQIDVRYSFYEERLTLAKFLINQDKVADAKEILEEIQSESNNMTNPNRRIYGSTITEVDKLLLDLS